MTRRDRHDHAKHPDDRAKDHAPGAENDAPQAAEPSPPDAAEAAMPAAAGGAGAAAGESAEQVKDRWLRAEAELQNFRRRALREWDEARRDGEERVMLEMIAALDDLDRALEAASKDATTHPWSEGVRLTAQRMREYLARQGVETLEPLGKPFDPSFHEAMRITRRNSTGVKRLKLVWYNSFSSSLNVTPRRSSTASFASTCAVRSSLPASGSDTVGRASTSSA